MQTLSKEFRAVKSDCCADGLGYVYFRLLLKRHVRQGTIEGVLICYLLTIGVILRPLNLLISVFADVLLMCFRIIMPVCH